MTKHARGDELARTFRDEGDDEAFNALMEEYQERLYSRCYRILHRSDLAMDVVQDTFVKVYNDIGKWGERSSFYSWAYRIATNKAIDRIRRQKRHKAAVDEIGQGLLHSRDNVAEMIDDKEKEYLMKRVAMGVSELPDAQRMTMVLRHYDGLSLKEIAEVRGCSLGTVKSTLYQALRKLIEIVRSQDREEVPNRADG